ncbi:hypothetical protein JST97_25235 [bacterium]|nr:hypothetical protein [bacterium]
MRQLLLLLWCLLAACVWAEPNFNYDRAQVKTLLNQGAPASHIDLVFVGDGYTASQSADLEKDARDALDSLWQYPLFKDYKQYFNAHLVTVPSIQEGTRLWYAFGSTNGTQGMIFVPKETELQQVARKAPDCDVVIVLTTAMGRAHSANIVVLPGRTFAPLPHELGHKIGKLGDEYDSLSSLGDRRSLDFGGGDIPYPNLTLAANVKSNSKDDVKKLKWGHFVDVPGAYPLVGAVQGGFYQAVGVYRPTYSCIMRGDNAPFCPVCHEEMVKAIFSKCGVRFDDGAYHRRHPISQWH